MLCGRQLEFSMGFSKNIYSSVLWSPLYISVPCNIFFLVLELWSLYCFTVFGGAGGGWVLWTS